MIEVIFIQHSVNPAWLKTALTIAPPPLKHSPHPPTNSKEQKGTAVRCRRWVRPLQRTGTAASTPALPHRAVAGTGAEGGDAGADLPEGLRPFCRPEGDGRVMALVHENQASSFFSSFPFFLFFFFFFSFFFFFVVDLSLFSGLCVRGEARSLTRYWTRKHGVKSS